MYSSLAVQYGAHTIGMNLLFPDHFRAVCVILEMIRKSHPVGPLPSCYN